MAVRNLVLVLGDQLSPDLSSLKAADPAQDRVLMVEVREEATYVRHHKKKIAFLFAAMRHFAEALRNTGWQLDYVALDAKDNAGSFTGEVNRAVARHSPKRLVVTEPGEWRLRDAMSRWADDLGLPVDVLEDDRFLCSRADFATWAEGRKQLRMEFFYRDMRRKTGLLMEGDKPEGGKWNFDAENRKPAKADLFLPQPHRVEPDTITQDVLDLVGQHFSDHFGDLQPFWFAVTAAQAEAALEHFVEHALPLFGDYQDAMLEGERFLYHSVLSLYINAGLLDPLAVCRRVESEYRAGRAPLNAAEGFIRQIIGWREYVRGIYWLKMPDYVEQNFFEADRPLPEFYWTAETDMACVKAAVTQTKEEAYAHHIQRLMVTGNFAMLAGVDPREVHEWYLAVYADAYEWVELPNTLGMSQFADGGLLGSKPYAASGNYINKMSDHCAHCRYDVKQKTGDNACPFNPLYWDFLLRNEEKLRGNPRLAQVYRTWARMSPEKQKDYRASAAKVLADLR
ncbi:cryptochrome/photolyase family protein [Pelagibius sp.]|uniref:cryptochrome/photolyase family protein n=1 Tax=Pelagibius sp. TaxID=1931238 RepID=UPI002629778D|nr:cryptochrome/photolyase family protein [Pelagibius sp.]